MATPQQLIDAEAEADRLIAEMNSEATPQTDGSEEAAPTPASQAGEAAPETTGEAAAAEEKPTKDVAPTALETQLAELKAQFEKLQAAHDTLRGKTYAEVPRVVAENKVLRDRIAELESQLTQKAAPPQAAAISKKASEILASLKEKTDEDVAEDIQKLVYAITEEQVSARVAPVEGRIEGLRKTAVELAEERYLKELTDKVSDWREIASTPEYSEFLSRRDDLSGATLYDLAKSALDRLDAGHMAVFFNKFKESKGVKPAPPPAAAAGTAERPSGKEALIAPKGAAQTASHESAGEKPDYITTKQLEQWNRKEYRLSLTREQEAALDARIDRAIQNRTIVPG